MVGSSSSTRVAPPLAGVLETVLYVDDLDRACAFYEGLLGFRRIGEAAGRFLFYRAGASVLLLFQREQSRLQTELPAHGSQGPTHVCFQAAAGRYHEWRAHLVSVGVAIVKDVSWSPGASFYFDDPDGNVLEIADRDIWPR